MRIILLCQDIHAHANTLLYFTLLYFTFFTLPYGTKILVLVKNKHSSVARSAKINLDLSYITAILVLLSHHVPASPFRCSNRHCLVGIAKHVQSEEEDLSISI